MQFALLLLLVATLAQSTPIRDDLVDIDQDFVMEQAEVLSFMDYVWTQTVTVGSAGEQFNVAIDTMSGLLYFPDKTCHNCDDGEVFDSSLSSTYHDTKKQFQENSPFGMAKGEIGMDTVVLGDNSSRSVTVQRATFGQVKDMEGRLFPEIDGILGLAFGSTAPNGAEPVFETAIRDRAVNAGIFTIWLEDQFATSDCGTHGVIYYGNYDPLHCKLDQKHIYPLSSAHFYQFTVPSVSVGSYTYNVRTQTIIQSMSQYIEAPMSFITKVLSQLGLPANTHLPAVVPCNTKISIGFNFAMGTETVTDLNLVVPADNGTCTLNLIQRGTALRNVEYFALGYPFLRGRCTFFDYTNQKIGFSEAKSHGGEHDATTPSML